jgi:hypothetical protein
VSLFLSGLICFVVFRLWSCPLSTPSKPVSNYRIIYLTKLFGTQVADEAAKEEARLAALEAKAHARDHEKKMQFSAKTIQRIFRAYLLRNPPSAKKSKGKGAGKKGKKGKKGK